MIFSDKVIDDLFFCVTFVFVPEVSKAVNAHSPREGHGVLRAFQHPGILGSHNNHYFYR